VTNYPVLPPDLPGPTAEERAILAAIAACPHRGDVLPLSRQPYLNGCRGCGELTECRAGKGKRSEGASTEDCVRCRAEALTSSGSDTVR
jgi:hypothetical protein